MHIAHMKLRNMYIAYLRLATYILRIVRRAIYMLREHGTHSTSTSTIPASRIFVISFGRAPMRLERCGA